MVSGAKIIRPFLDFNQVFTHHIFSIIVYLSLLLNLLVVCMKRNADDLFWGFVLYSPVLVLIIPNEQDLYNRIIEIYAEHLKECGILI